jgi:hypothetical protein
MNEVQLRDAMAELLDGEPRSAVDAHRALARGRLARRVRRLKVTAAVAAVAVVLVVTAPLSRGFLVGGKINPSTPSVPRPTPTISLGPRIGPYIGYPDSIAVIGHTTAMGRASIPENLAADAEENSWATGANPAVESVYARILAHNPRIYGHQRNLSSVDATVDNATIQTAQAAAMRPPPELVLMQVMDYDIRCPASSDDFENFRLAMLAALQELHRGAPYTRVFVVSMFGSATTLAQVLSDELKEFGNAQSGFSCATVDESGHIDPQHMRLFEEATHGFEGAIKDACAQVPLCVYDDGAFGNTVERREDLAPDFIHLTVKGQAHAAEVAWAALQKAGLIQQG